MLSRTFLLAGLVASASAFAPGAFTPKFQLRANAALSRPVARAGKFAIGYLLTRKGKGLGDETRDQ
jgi:hypothetical protein